MDIVFKALSERGRLRILALLLTAEACVCEIENSLQMTQSNASRHLTALKRCGILESEKHAQWAYYRISDRFKAENEQLWLYLESNLKKMPEYLSDAKAFQSCKEKDLCGCEKNVKERGG